MWVGLGNDDTVRRFGPRTGHLGLVPWFSSYTDPSGLGNKRWTGHAISLRLPDPVFQTSLTQYFGESLGTLTNSRVSVHDLVTNTVGSRRHRVSCRHCVFVVGLTSYLCLPWRPPVLVHSLLNDLERKIRPISCLRPIETPFKETPCKNRTGSTSKSWARHVYFGDYIENTITNQ